MTLFIFIFYIIVFGTDISFIFPLMIVMISISSFSYDELNNWNSYAITFPKGRENIVKAKYISTIILGIISIIASVFLSILIGMYKNNLNIDNILSSMSGSVTAVVIIMSLTFPILFKFGATKGRSSLYIVGMTCALITSFVTRMNINCN